MTEMKKVRMRIGAWAAALLLGTAMLGVQARGQNPPPAPQQSDKDKDKAPPNVQELTLDGIPAAVPAPVNAEEDGAMKAFSEAPATDMNKKIQLGEDFLTKYPQSRYRPTVYSMLTMIYLATNQVPKALETGDKELQLNPNDVQVLAALSRAIPRALSKDTQEPRKQLAKAEEYGRRAIEVMPTIPKPQGVTDETFALAKNDALSMAHSGLGVTYFRLAKYPEAISELEQAVKLDPAKEPDPVNYYVLAVANENASHFDDAAAAFTKCAALTSQLQAACKAGADDAKKKGQTQLSAPK